MLQGLKLKDVKDKLEGIADSERFSPWYKTTLLDQFQVEHVINEAEQEIYLTDEQDYESMAGILQWKLEHVLEYH